MTANKIAMRDAFLVKIWQEMSINVDIFFVTADFGSPVLDRIRKDFPDRFVNVGIAEQNLINITAGLALEGYTVFAYAIAPFITMRCFEQIRVSLALLSEVRPMNVNLIGVGAGYSYVVSGPTHQCYEDITIMRALPNFRLLSPADHVIAEDLFDSCVDKKGLTYLRFDAQVLPVIYKTGLPLISDGVYVHKEGEDICLIATGFMLHTALHVADILSKENKQIGVIDMFDLTQFSKEKLKEIISRYSVVISLEEGFSGCGGLDSLLLNFVSQNQLDVKVVGIGVNPGYSFELGSRAELHEKAGIGPDSVLSKAYYFLNQTF
jgi:transketolase